MASKRSKLSKAEEQLETEPPLPLPVPVEKIKKEDTEKKKGTSESSKLKSKVAKKKAKETVRVPDDGGCDLWLPDPPGFEEELWSLFQTDQNTDEVSRSQLIEILEENESTGTRQELNRGRKRKRPSRFI